MKKQHDSEKISSNHFKNTSMKLSYKMQGAKDEQMWILLYYKNLTLEIALVVLSPFYCSGKVLLG